MYRPGHCRYIVGVLTGFVFCWARAVVMCFFFCGPSSCVSVGVAGVRGGQHGDPPRIPEDGQCRPKHVVTGHV
jgi:hypothetical protein